MDKEKILIVDDDENIAELISLYLNKECYETQIATDGASALEAFVEFMPNLILLDVMLPGMDGYQVCTRSESSQMYRSSCYPQKARYLTRCSDLRSAPMITS